MTANNAPTGVDASNRPANVTSVIAMSVTRSRSVSRGSSGEVMARAAWVSNAIAFASGSSDSRLLTGAPSGVTSTSDLVPSGQVTTAGDAVVAPLASERHVDDPRRRSRVHEPERRTTKAHPAPVMAPETLERPEGIAQVDRTGLEGQLSNSRELPRAQLGLDACRVGTEIHERAPLVCAVLDGSATSAASSPSSVEPASSYPRRST